MSLHRRGQLEQWRQRWAVQAERQQSPLERELEHRVPLRSNKCQMSQTQGSDSSA